MGAPTSAGRPGGRIWDLLRRPTIAWREIAVEAAPPVRGVVLRVAPLSALPPFCQAAGRILALRPMMQGSGAHVLFVLFAEAFIAWLLILFGVVCLALASWLLARPFGGVLGRRRSLVLAVYASVPGWIGGLAYLAPRFDGIAAGFVLYGLYVFYRGAEVMTSPAGLRGRIGYVSLVLGCYIAAVSLATQGVKLVLELL